MIDMFKALADTNRLKIVELLSNKPSCVYEIERDLDLPQNLVSHHLAVLKEAKIVENCKCGKNNYYSLNKKALLSLAKKIKNIIKESGGNK
ncbi:MAG: metalloregulator ArsR/SmtB family transcription factor [Candidatus Berkelbacteria bacterium]|nr:metalloregulator ArsR/SmtB family transcription factor [Candidatus Berkelbacteria bacterium]